MYPDDPSTCLRSNADSCTLSPMYGPTDGPPADNKEGNETVMSNFDGRIDRTLAERLRYEKVVLSYAARAFHGEVWWDRAAAQYRCLIRVYGVRKAVISSPTLEEIMRLASDRYGEE